MPALPRALADPRPVGLIGTVLWCAGMVFFGLQAATGGELDVRFWTCLAGFLIGVTGYGVFRWQRAATQRGTRGSWRGSGLGD